MIRIIIILVLMCINASSAADHPIFNSIKKLSPDINDKQAKKYATIIEKYSKEYQVDWHIVLAIFRQESNFQLDAVNYASGDYGIGQIHHTNIKAKKLSLVKLLTDPEYAINQTFVMLSELKKSYEKKEKNTWFTRYHSFKAENRKEYHGILKKWLKEMGKPAK